ncbi:MAG TPA: J domain-containing protein [Solirubrobacteraceae bacterium]|nr:J domain-containing protein [Solirubrobacteraceae bacterium]
MDPFSVLGLPPGASAEEASAAYRELAKRWHPDRRRGADAAARMAQINVAYDMLRAGDWQRAAPPRPAPGGARTPGVRARPAAGAWLDEPLRRALGRELLLALEDREEVAIVTPAATWASPRTLLAVTDRRLLWLLDDAPTNRVRSLRYGAIREVAHQLRRPLRRVAVLRVRTVHGRGLSFTELRPATAAAIAGHVGGARLAALGTRAAS